MRGILKQFFSREASPFIQFVKYAISGVAALATHIVIFYFLSLLLLPALNDQDAAVRFFDISAAGITDTERARNAMVNNALAFIISNFAAYMMNILWVFEAGKTYPPVDFMLSALGLDSRRRLRSIAHRAVEITLFYAISGLAITIGTIVMGIQINKFQVTTTAAFITQSIITMMINFALRKILIFKR